MYIWDRSGVCMYGMLYMYICCREWEYFHYCWKYVFPQESSCFLDIPPVVEKSKTVYTEG